MSESERFTPPEAENFSADEQKEQKEKKAPSETTINRIRKGPEASGVPRNRTDAEGNLITPEHEQYPSPDTTKEIEHGVGPNPTWSGPPDDAGTSPAADAAATDDPGSAGDSPGEPDTGALSEPDPEAQKTLDDVKRLREEEQREFEEDMQTLEEQKATNAPVEGGPPSPAGDEVAVQSDRDVSFPPIPDDLVDEIVHIKNLPVEERRAAVAELMSRTDRLGNRPHDVKQLGELNSRVLPGGKGIIFEDATGYQHVIRYE